jgi:dihydrofolate reductase
MRKLILYIAMSLDGKIAGPQDDVKWLEELPNPDKSDYGYHDFVKSVDTTIMGNTTYQWISRQPIPFPYPDTKNYVLTRSEQESNDEVTFLSKDIPGFIEQLKQKEGKNIWLIGGGGVNQVCLDAGLIDEMRVFVMPVILGEGVPLFAEGYERSGVRLISSTTYSSGVVELVYALDKK